MGLFDDDIATRKLLGKGGSTERRWSPVFTGLVKHLKHDDARRMTKRDLMAWRDTLLTTKSPKTVSDVWLAAVRTVLNWAMREDRLGENVAIDVRQEVPKQRRSRERGFTTDEATAIFRASRAHESRKSPDGTVKESPKTAAAKQWVPLLCAFTGTRAPEITQLRGQDVRKDGQSWVIRITPDAGTVKAGGYRDVPLHSQIIDLGFLDFVQHSEPGPLFYQSSSAGGSLAGARAVSGRLSEWLGETNLIPEGVAPSHGWRHRFKTVGREIGAEDRVLDGICGHSGRTAGDNYGDVTIAAMKTVIDRLPQYDLDGG